MSRRNTELLLLCLAAPFVVLLFAMVLVQQGTALSLESLTAPLGLFAAFVVAHIATRFLAKNADPAILPITFGLSGIGIAFVTRLAPDLAVSQIIWLFVGIACMVITLAVVRNIDRHVQLSYPFYMFGEKSFEIDEDGHPWWICPVKDFTIGLFGGETISRVVLCDATTGETQDLAVADCPEWVDRVFPAELLIQQYNWWGAYNNGWLNSFLGQEGVVRTTPGTDGTLGYNYIAKDDDVWVYTGVTSATADNSIIGFVLVNQRTQESHFYSVSGATEDSAMQSAEGQVQNLRYTSTFPLLINVSNQPTYFMALKDGAGLVKKFAMIDIQRYQNVAVGDTVADTQKAYEALLATNGVVAEGEGGTTDVVTVKGTIRSMNQAVIEGNTHFYLTVEGEDGSIFDFALPGLLDIVGYKVGDEINFTYVEAAGSNVSPAYEILGEGGKASENASGEPEDDVVQDNGAAQTPADVASGEDTEKVA